MRVVPVLKAASGGITRRLLQSCAVLVVLTAATAAATLALSLFTNANEAFTNGFATHHGADIELTVNTAVASHAQLAATRHVPGVLQVAGPYPELNITVVPGGQITVTARSSKGGPLEDLTVQSGHWLTGPGQIVLAPYYGTSGPVGSKLTVLSAPGRPKLTIAGYGGSVGRIGQAWVLPSELAALRQAHPRSTAKPIAQMLYTFSKASTTFEIAADVRALKAALPARAVTGYESWLDSEGQTFTEQSANTPFVLTFALLSLVLAVLIVAAVVSGAVLAGYRRIGVLKSIGFTPMQVAAAYLAQIGVPTLAGAAAGTFLGNLWAAPTLNMAAGLFQAGRQHVPVWIDMAVPAGMCALVALAALIPALRAGSQSAVRAITAGQAPPAGSGQVAHRLAGKLALPRPVTVGLAAPFTRPARTALITGTITFGVTAVILAVGLNASLARLQQLGINGQPQHISVLPGKGSASPVLTVSQSRKAVAAIRAQHGTLRYVAAAEEGRVINSASVPGLDGLNLVAYDGPSSWLGFPLIAGHWYSTAGEVDVNTGFLALTGLTVGDHFTLRVQGRPVAVRVAGQFYDPNGPSMYTSWQTLGGAATGLRATSYAVEVRPGMNLRAYQAGLQQTLGRGLVAIIPSGNGGPGGPVSPAALIRLLTELIAALAAIGVFMSILTLSRERVHDLGVFKALGMTPRQTVSMVSCWAIAPAVAAGLIAVPVAIVLHALTVEGIGSITQTGTPTIALAVYRPGQLAGLALSGLLIAIAGGLGPATWAAAAKSATALRAE